MNLDLDLSAVSRLFRGLLTDVRQKRLWPVMVVLAAACAAVPVLLSSSTTPSPPPAASLPTPPPAPAASIPTLNVQTTPTHARIVGPSHDPFAGAATTTTTPRTTVTTVASTVSTAASSAAGNALSTVTGGTGSTRPPIPVSGGSVSPVTSAPTTFKSAKPKAVAVATGLKPTQAYEVSLAVTNSSGGVNTIDPVTRLSMIPNAQQPLLVELGVTENGHRVLFAVQPGTIVSGPGTCIPGPIDCEILSLAANQTEKLSVQTGSGGPSEVAQFEVAGIGVNNYASSALAHRARRAHSSAGHALLAKSSLAALALFRYERGLGSVVDLRNLKVGR